MENNDIDNNDYGDILAKNDSKLLIINNINSDYDTQSHFTSNILTKYEKVMIIIERTQQIMQGANPLIDNFKKLKVLVIGETIIDQYVFCEALGKSGKEPVLVLRDIKTEEYLGGAAALSRHLSQFCNICCIIPGPS